MTQLKNDKNIYRIVLDLIYIIIGAFAITIGINIFLLPHKMTTGGASGIATVVYYLFNIPMGLTVMIINIPLFIISLTKLGIRFSIKTIISTVLLSIFLDVFTFDTIVKQINTDFFTSCLFGGIVVGIGLSFTFKAGASSGGSDLLAQIIYNFTSFQSISQILLVIEIVIISTIIIVFKDINLGFYSIIAMYVSTKVIDILFEGIYYTRQVNIITKNKDKIINEILYDLRRGATITNCIGAHSNKEIYLITCIINRSQLSKIKGIVRNNDKDALVYISNVNEAIGTGFKKLNA